MIILNEKEYAEKCLENGIVDRNPYQAIATLSKYYYHCCNYRKKKITVLLVDFLKKYYPRYELNEYQWLDTIDKLATRAKLQPPYEISGVKITKSEIATIKSIKSKSLEKLAFTMLCLAKFNNLRNPSNNGWVNTDRTEIYNLARYSCSKDNRDINIGKLRQMGLVELPKRNDNLNCRITFINDEDEEELFISDFRELGYEYLNYLGEKFIRCSECDALTRIGETNRKTHCSRCKPNDTKQEEKVIFCIDCRKPVTVSSKDNQTNRCPECYEVYRKNRKLETQKIRRNNAKMKSAQN